MASCSRQPYTHFYDAGMELFPSAASKSGPEQCVGFIPCRPRCTCRKADASTSMTNVGEDRPKSASVLKKGSLARGAMKPKKGSLKPRKSSKTRKKSRSSSRSSRASRPSNRPSSAPSLRGSVRSSKAKKSWTFPPLGGKPISRVDFAGSMKPVWSQSPEVETFYSRKSNVEKRPHSASLTMKKAFSETLKKRPSTAPMQKPSIRAWRRRVRGILSSSSDFDVSSVCCPNPQIPNRHPYRNVPAYVDLASFLYPDYFWTLVDHFLQNQEWPRWATLEPSFQKVCAQFNIDGSTTLHMIGFAPLWVNLLRQTDEVMFRTVVGHFFFAHKFPSWSIFPRCILEMFQNAGIKEYDYAN